MPLNFHIGLPGPFSYSVRATPNIGKTVRQVNRAARSLAEQDKPCPCAHRPPTQPVNPRPQDRTITDDGPGGGAAALWVLGLTLVILTILGFSGFRLY